MTDQELAPKEIKEQELLDLKLTITDKSGRVHVLDVVRSSPSDEFKIDWTGNNRLLNQRLQQICDDVNKTDMRLV